MRKSKNRSNIRSRVSVKNLFRHAHLHLLSSSVGVAVIASILSFASTKAHQVRASEPQAMTLDRVNGTWSMPGDSAAHSDSLKRVSDQITIDSAAAVQMASADTIIRDLPAPFPSVKGGWKGVDAYDRYAAEMLPANLPHRREIVRASIEYGINAMLLAAVGNQETRLGTELDSNARGDHGHGYGIFQLDDQKRGVTQAGRDLRILETAAHDVLYAARYAAAMLRESLDRNVGNIAKALQEYNAGSAASLGAPRKWPDARLYYANSTLRYYKYLLQGMA